MCGVVLQLVHFLRMPRAHLQLVHTEGDEAGQIDAVDITGAVRCGQGHVRRVRHVINGQPFHMNAPAHFGEQRGLHRHNSDG